MIIQRHKIVRFWRLYNSFYIFYLTSIRNTRSLKDSSSQYSFCRHDHIPWVVERKLFSEVRHKEFRFRKFSLGTLAICCFLPSPCKARAILCILLFEKYILPERTLLARTSSPASPGKFFTGCALQAVFHYLSARGKHCVLERILKNENYVIHCFTAHLPICSLEQNCLREFFQIISNRNYSSWS